MLYEEYTCWKKSKAHMIRRGYLFCTVGSGHVVYAASPPPLHPRILPGLGNLTNQEDGSINQTHFDQ